MNTFQQEFLKWMQYKRSTRKSNMVIIILVILTLFAAVVVIGGINREINGLSPSYDKTDTIVDLFFGLFEAMFIIIAAMFILMAGTIILLIISLVAGAGALATLGIRKAKAAYPSPPLKENRADDLLFLIKMFAGETDNGFRNEIAKPIHYILSQHTQTPEDTSELIKEYEEKNGKNLVDVVKDIQMHQNGEQNFTKYFANINT